MDEQAIEARVAKGAEFLDRHEPGWADRIDLRRLVVSDCNRCVVGQVYCERHGLDWLENVPGPARSFYATYGFDSRYRSSGEYAALRKAWVATIKERRNMNIGTEKETHRVEPAVDPIPRKVPQERPARKPQTVPRHEPDPATPERSPAKEPAKR